MDTDFCFIELFFSYLCCPGHAVNFKAQTILSLQMKPLRLPGTPAICDCTQFTQFLFLKKNEEKNLLCSSENKLAFYFWLLF